MAIKRVIVMAGGTGGHVFPALSVAKELQERGVEVHWLGTDRGIEARLVPAAGYPLHCLNMQGIRGKNPLFRLLAVAKASLSVFSALGLIMRLRPFCVIGLGGYASGPGGLAAALIGCPLLIQEQNAVAGTTNRLLAKFARFSLTGYPIGLGGKRNRYIGNPVRQEIAELPAPAERFAGRQGALRVLILGGSLGAKPINDVVLQLWRDLAEGQRPELWHQTGAAHAEVLSEQYAQQGIAVRCEAFIDDMAAAYAWADVVVCRAGALTVAELAAAGVPAILIPLPHAIDDHQRANAQWFVDGGAGKIIDQKDFSAESLNQVLEQWSNDRAGLLQMAQSARALAKTDAAHVAADFCMKFDKKAFGKTVNKKQAEGERHVD
ncbi:undecaprenyldiphospho-muramoylpentapeptide beta-N-acetylglucosaminyltransferase [Spongiibacter sp. KMU-158]|uniref:UDP-N-acetylglucosamine--N-acetylmuramyl-(pentapeptide) pyrophosphoryl-undecaprenol N-acetylglucosamine transferase n=1 Tax=Spongiibacter pelagi TaxID=2760804 RepID=A0A927C1U9_9GAMM|nr:undecaprenyldiphospho-muramoylpentapeptide beta-N-acetylglucosaminyltransferase [Spongiibacter pelagi]MBD2859740.1 undecaprenyldiphospho-muramoylpentapeptide beta-N-acetylglucosaminyltransferase [Spongiibacter pelagi]